VHKNIITEELVAFLPNPLYITSEKGFTWEPTSQQYYDEGWRDIYLIPWEEPPDMVFIGYDIPEWNETNDRYEALPLDMDEAAYNAALATVELQRQWDKPAEQVANEIAYFALTVEILTYLEDDRAEDDPPVLLTHAETMDLIADVRATSVLDALEYRVRLLEIDQTGRRHNDSWWLDCFWFDEPGDQSGAGANRPAAPALPIPQVDVWMLDDSEEPEPWEDPGEAEQPEDPEGSYW